VPLPVTFPSYVVPIRMGDAQHTGEFNLRELAPEWERHHRSLGALAGAFALNDYLVRSRLPVQWIGICQYRKFVSRMAIGGAPAANFPTMNVISKGDIEPGAFADAMLPRGTDFLIGAACPPSATDATLGYYEQYKEAHVAQDLLRFTAEAVELGVLHRDEAMDFLNETELVPGGIELGVYPTEFWMRTMSEIESVVRACLERHPAVRDGYQARAWAFCAERLGSYLLLRHLRRAHGHTGWQAAFVGQLNLIGEAHAAEYVPGV
jgi:hypothetical protein